MEVLPHRAANGAGNAYVMLQTGQTTLDCQRDEFCHYGSALDPKPSIVEKLQVTGGVSYDKAAKPFITNENVCAEAEDEIVDPKLACRADRPCQIIGRCGIVEEIGGTADLECGVLTERLASLEPLRLQSSLQLPVMIRARFHCI